jgi:hypothetical protein
LDLVKDLLDKYTHHSPPKVDSVTKASSFPLKKTQTGGTCTTRLGPNCYGSPSNTSAAANATPTMLGPVCAANGGDM